jgi:hypothetical protein
MKRAVLAVMMLCCAALLLPAGALATATVHYASTGAEQTFEVPAGVYQVGFVAIGGKGGEASGVAGGEAAEVEGTLEVDQFETLYVEVGGNGKTAAEGGAGGFNGGGSSSGGGGGGGASDIRTSPRAAGLSPDTRMVAAGGAGGAGGAGSEGGGKGGAAGEAGETSSGFNEGGGAGTTVGGGGALGCSGSGETGLLGLGGNGGSGESTNAGGGGGGGFWGGGGGGGGCSLGGGGGGGGSTLLPAFALMTLTSAAPKIDISYNPPPTITITTPAEEAAYTQGQAINANYSCQPGEGSSVKTCAGPVANGAPLETAAVGEHEFLVKAEDNDKGKAGESVNYTVFAPPAVEITSPAEGATYAQGQAVSAAYACHPAPSLAVESCSGPVSSGAAVNTASPGPQTFTVKAEDSIGGTTTRSVHYTVAAASEGPTPAVPDTILGSRPKKTVKTKKKKATVKFSFSSDVAGATFQCKLDKGSFAPCASPKTYKVKKGKHTFSVEAVAPGGTDATPATFSFKVKKKK